MGWHKISDWLFFLFLLISIKGFFLWIDHRPMFFFGDSASYIWTALTGWVPPDRSFIYGCFIRSVSVTTQSLLSLVIAQVCLSGISAIVLAHILIRYFNVKRWLAFSVAVLMCFEPLQLMYERYVMTETLALTIFSLYLWAILHYMEEPRLRWLWMIQGIAILLISIRFAFIPQVWICSVLVPLIAAPSIIASSEFSRGKKVGRVLIHLIMSILILYLFDAGYKNLIEYFKKSPPAYSYDGGSFALAFILPIVKPTDFPDESLGNNVLNGLYFPKSDRRARDAHRWSEGGAVAQLSKLEPDKIKADILSKQVAINAVTRRPFEFICLVLETFTDYFDQSYLKSCDEIDLGNRKLEPQFLKSVTEHFNYPEDRSSALDLKTVSGRYFLHSWIWFQVLLFLPLCSLLIITLRNNVQSHIGLFICLICILSVGVAIVLANRPTVRYLHTAAWLFFLVMGIGLNHLFTLQKNEIFNGFFARFHFNPRNTKSARICLSHVIRNSRLDKVWMSFN
jgi:hypothetical protein